MAELNPSKDCAERGLPVVTGYVFANLYIIYKFVLDTPASIWFNLAAHT
jgi:hypothetical protein